MHARTVWGRLGFFLIWEGSNPRVEAMFYRVVVQVVLLFGLDTSLLSAAMERKLEGTHVGFLKYITGK